MKLLVDCHGFDFNISQGITTYIEGLYRSVIRLSSEIEFYFVAKDIDKIKAIFGESDKIKYIPLTSKNRIYRLLFEIPRIVKKYKIDVAHYQYVSPIIKNCKTIVTLHDILFIDFPEYFPFSYRFFKGISFELSAKRADLLCTVSEYSRIQISHHYKINSNGIIITPNAVSDDFYLIEGDKPSSFPDKYVLYVSRIEPRKNHITAVHSFVRTNLFEKGYKLVFIGRETVFTEELHKTIENLPKFIKDHILFIPQVSFENLKLWYKYASLFLYPTLAEGFGIPPIEAGAACIPVICNNTTAMSDFKMFGENLIDFMDEEKLDDRIIRQLSSSNNMSELKNISEEIKKTYNWDNIAKKFIISLSKLNV